MIPSEISAAEAPAHVKMIVGFIATRMKPVRNDFACSTFDHFLLLFGGAYAGFMANNEAPIIRKTRMEIASETIFNFSMY